jgi:predicted ATP-binding protein involved in virulence
MIKINTLRLIGIGPIKDVQLEFNKHFNIICGQNGIGKTTILDAMAQAFSIRETNLKRNSNCANGIIQIEVSIDEENHSKTIPVNTFSPMEQQRTDVGFYQQALEVVVFKTHRDIPYNRLQSLSTDPQKSINDNARQTLTGTLSSELKNWFVNRHLWSKHDGHLDEGQIRNINLAKNTIGLLNEDMSFSRVDPRTNDILINTPDGEIYFEYLSSGYKSCLAVLMGIIKEIEFRYHSPSIFASDFKGIVFIDEIDLHLHPEWQAKIYLGLKRILPNAQVFTSTHSPHLIQVAEANEIIPLVRDAESNTRLNEVVNTDFGYQGWTVEEILTDVMGMSETRTDIYHNAINDFNSALENENISQLNSAYSKISKMLHPNNPLRKIFQIQMVGVGEND